MVERTEAPAERDKLLLVRGVNARVADLLEQNGYTSVAVIAGEEDTDRLAIKSGLGASKAQALKAAVAEFVETEWPPVDVKMQESIEAAQAEAARLEAEAAAAAEAEAAAAAEAEAAAEAAAEPEAETGSETEAVSGAEGAGETADPGETKQE